MADSLSTRVNLTKTLRLEPELLSHLDDCFGPHGFEPDPDECALCGRLKTKIVAARSACSNIECKDGIDQHVNAPCQDCNPR